MVHVLVRRAPPAGHHKDGNRSDLDKQAGRLLVEASYRVDGSRLEDGPGAWIAGQPFGVRLVRAGQAAGGSTSSTAPELSALGVTAVLLGSALAPLDLFTASSPISKLRRRPWSGW